LYCEAANTLKFEVALGRGVPRPSKLRLYGAGDRPAY
jgi:hypothetical protein